MRSGQKSDFARLWNISIDMRSKQIPDSSPSVIAGLSGSAFLLTLFTLLTNRVAKNNPLEMDQTFEQWLSKIDSPGFNKYFKGFTQLGREPATLSLSLVAFGFLQQRKQPLAAWMVLISTWGGWLLSRPVKLLIKRPRPLSINTLVNHPDAKSYPSGHSMVAACFYGILIWAGFSLFKRKLSRAGWVILMIYLILMIGLSRAYLKEHHPTDVLGGYLLGSFWLTVVICSANMYGSHRDN